METDYYEIEQEKGSVGPLRVFTQIKKYQTTLLANGQEEATQDL